MGAKLEDILSEVDSGPFTWIVFVLCSVWGLFGAMQAMAAAFLNAATDHWCDVPELHNTSWTFEQRRNFSIPPSNSSDGGYSSCEMYDRNYSSVQGMDYEEAMYGGYFLTNASVVKCSSWQYDKSVMSSTVISEWDLVCDRDYLRSFTQSVFMAGVFLGSFVNGYLADKFGRKKILSFALVLFIATSASGAIVQWYPAFLASRFGSAITGHCIYQTSYVIAVESSSIRHRGTVGILFSVPFALGNILLPGIAYLVRDWRYLLLSISLPVVLLFLNTIILPESPRWLIQRGRKEEAAKELQKAARWNGRKPFDSDWLAAMISEIHSGAHDHRKSTDDEDSDDGHLSVVQSIRILVGSVFMLKITTIVSALWVTCTMVYYGISMNAPNLSADPFLFMVIGGAVEIPCYILGAPIVTKIGRRWTVILSFLMTAIAVLGPLAIPAAEKSSWWFITLFMVGKMSITLGFQVMYLYTSELYPTCIRTHGLGVTSMVGRTGAIISPFITDELGSRYWYMPSVIFGICSVISCLLTFFLPETMSRDLPDTVQEMQKWNKGSSSEPSEGGGEDVALKGGTQLDVSGVATTANRHEPLLNGV